MKIHLKNKPVRSGNTENSSKNGYSLIEVLVSLFVISMGVTAVASLMTASIKSTINSRNQIIASLLAQEGVELVQNLNDNKRPITNGSHTIGHGDNQLDATADNKLYLSGGFYYHIVDAPTKYLRRVDIAGFDGGIGDQFTVTSTVSWNGVNILVAESCTVANKCLSITNVMTSKQ